MSYLVFAILLFPLVLFLIYYHYNTKPKTKTTTKHTTAKQTFPHPMQNELLIHVEDILLLSLVGTGSFSEVWKGKWNLIDVAVKKLVSHAAFPQTGSALVQELAFSASLRHPNVVQMYGVCMPNDSTVFLVMEFADGGDLTTALNNPSLEIPWTQRWQWGLEAAAAVSFLHSKGIVHRDIKSPNFLIIGGKLKITDFGVSTLTSLASLATRTSNELVVGTARWAAPESSAQKPIVNEKSDVYALGICLWEIAARQIPFSEIRDNAQVIFLVRYEQTRPEIPPNFPSIFSSIITRCWDQNPELRPSAREVHEYFCNASSARLQEMLVPVSFTDPNRFSRAGMVTTFAGGTMGYKNGKGREAQLTWPHSICFNERENCFYFSQENRTIKKLTLDGSVTSLAEVEGGHIFGMTVDTNENILYMANTTCSVIQALSLSGGAVREVAGSLRKTGIWNGVRSDALFNGPRGIAVAKDGTIYVTDSNNQLIRAINKKGEVSTITGTALVYTPSAHLIYPMGMCIDNYGFLIVCDRNHNLLRRFQTNGVVHDVCLIPKPVSVAIAKNGVLLVMSHNHQLYRVAPSADRLGKAEVIAGTGREGLVDGTPDECCFDAAEGVAIHEASHSCFVADKRNNVIRKISFQ